MTVTSRDETHDTNVPGVDHGLGREFIGTDPSTMANRSGASAREPPTGPLPIVDLAEGHLHVTRRRNVMIASIDGGLDDDLAASLVPTLTELAGSAEAVVLEVDQTTLLGREAFDRVISAISQKLGDDSCCLVAGRLSGRMVLDRWGIGSRFAVFATLADALQAREFAKSGYGTGWSVNP